MSKVFILGGGVTGLASAYHLSKYSDREVVLFEAEHEMQGLVRNFGGDGWVLEYGPHNIHTQNLRVMAFLKEIFGERLKERNIKTLLFIFNKKVKYPLKGLDVLLVLKPWQMIVAGMDFLYTRMRAFLFGVKPTAHFDEWIGRRYGNTLLKIYFAPYVGKVWKMDPHDLSSYVGEKRIPHLSLRQLVYKQLNIKSNHDPHPEDVANVHSYMPVGGSGKITEYFKAQAEAAGCRLHTDSEVERVVLRAGRVVQLGIRNRKSETLELHDVGPDDIVISTIPINRLLLKIDDLPAEVMKSAEGLDYTCLVMLHIRLRRQSVFGKSWVYFSNPDVIFNRISEYSRDDLEMVPPECCSLCVEIPCRYGDELWNMPKDELFALVMRQLAPHADIDPQGVVGFSREEVRYAYPKFSVGFQKRLLTIKKYLLLETNIVSLGRQGLFCYSNIDQCIDMAFNMADVIIKDPNNAKYVYQEMFMYYHQTPQVLI